MDTVELVRVVKTRAIRRPAGRSGEAAQEHNAHCRRRGLRHPIQGSAFRQSAEVTPAAARDLAPNLQGEGGGGHQGVTELVEGDTDQRVPIDPERRLRRAARP
jgi:hypothetical protein